MRVEVALAEIVRADLEHADVARVTVTGQRVDDDQGVVPVKKVVGEMHPADPVVDRPDRFGQVGGREEPPDDLGAESVVSAEEVADAGNQNTHGQGWSSLHVAHLQVSLDVGE